MRIKITVILQVNMNVEELCEYRHIIILISDMNDETVINPCNFIHLLHYQTGKWDIVLLFAVRRTANIFFSTSVTKIE